MKNSTIANKSLSLAMDYIMEEIDNESITVQDLITSLQKVKDKNKKISFERVYECFHAVYKITEKSNKVEIWLDCDDVDNDKMGE